MARTFGREEVGAILGGILAIALVLSTAALALPGNTQVRVTSVLWSATTTGSTNGTAAQRVIGLPYSSPGAVVAPGSGLNASIVLTVDPTYGASCFIDGFDVSPGPFLYANIPGWQIPVYSGYPLTLYIPAPSVPFGPGPIEVTIITSTVAGCEACP